MRYIEPRRSRLFASAPISHGPRSKVSSVRLALGGAGLIGGGVLGSKLGRNHVEKKRDEAWAGPYNAPHMPTYWSQWQSSDPYKEDHTAALTSDFAEYAARAQGYEAGYQVSDRPISAGAIAGSGLGLGAGLGAARFIATRGRSKLSNYDPYADYGGYSDDPYADYGGYEEQYGEAPAAGRSGVNPAVVGLGVGAAAAVPAYHFGSRRAEAGLQRSLANAQGGYDFATSQVDRATNQHARTQMQLAEFEAKRATHAQSRPGWFGRGAHKQKLKGMDSTVSYFRGVEGNHRAAMQKAMADQESWAKGVRRATDAYQNRAGTMRGAGRLWAAGALAIPAAIGYMSRDPR